MKNFKFGFDAWAFLLFAIIMAPNIFSMMYSPPFYFLTQPSVTPEIDMIMSVSQYAMIAALCMFINTNANKIKFTPLIGFAVFFSVMYWISWGVCYADIWNAYVVMALCIFPCAAFILYIIDRKNYIAFPFAVIFSVLHIVRSVINFILVSRL